MRVTPGAGGARSSRRRAVALVAGTAVAAALAGAGAYALRRSGAARDSGAPPSIAVLPFEDLSPARDQEYFSDGVSEELLTALSKVQGLRVPGRTSSFYFKGRGARIEEVGRELQVEHVLEGSVRRSGKRLRISAELVRTRDGQRLWSHTFDKELTDVFAVQDEIARDVVDALRVKLLPGRGAPAREYRPWNLEAYQSYLLGKHLGQSFSEESQRRAVAALEKAVELDPGFPQAWASLALSRLALGSVLGPPYWAEGRREARVASDRAVALAPDLPLALAARAGTRLADWDWAGAKADLDRAVALDPDDAEVLRALANYMNFIGLPGESLRRKVLEREPLDGKAWNALGVSLWFASRPDEADRAFARALEFDPRNDFAPRNRAWMAIDAGRPAEALPYCESNRERGCLACAYQALGRAAESRAALDAMLAEPGERRNAFYLAWAHACRGEPDQAFAWLERARVDHLRIMGNVKLAPFFRSLHADPRWGELLRRMNLPAD